MKKFVAVVLSLTLLMGLCGCGGPGKSTDDELNKTVEVPDGTLSFKVNDTWKNELEGDLGLDIFADDIGAYYPRSNSDEIAITYFHTNIFEYGLTKDDLTPDLFEEILKAMNDDVLAEYKIEELTVDESFSEYYYFAFSSEVEDEDYGLFRSCQIFLLDQSGLSNVGITVSVDTLDQWESTVESFIASVMPLDHAKTKAQIAGL